MAASPPAAADLRAARLALPHFALLLLAWTAAWLLYRLLLPLWPVLASGAAERIWWLSAKLLIWLAPCIFLLLREARACGRGTAGLLEELGLGAGSHRRGLLWGLAGGVLIIALNLLALSLGFRELSGHWVSVFAPMALVSSLQAPVLEEALLRGFFQPRLERVYGSPWAFVLSALLFLALHLPGWYFKGQLSTVQTWLPLSLSILAIGLLCAWLRWRSKSLLAPIFVHWVNNLAAGILVAP